MRQTLSAPCAQCPFRSDRPGFLSRTRVREIVESVYRQESFPCHKTIDYGADDDGGEPAGRIPRADEIQCAGAEIFHVRTRGGSSQMRRIVGRLGLPVAELDMGAPVFASERAMLAAQPDAKRVRP